MNKQQELEFAGYGFLSNLLTKLHKLLSQPINKLAKWAERLDFEQYKMQFGERDSDIYIVTYPKSGTTVMQMILYQLTTNGSMNFNHIYEVSPWIRNASFLKQKPVTDLPSPRIIKSHDSYSVFGKETKGKFIYVYRNGMDVAVSLYHQNKNYNNSKLDFDKFLNTGFLKKKPWIKHAKAWLANKKKLPVLYIRYEDLIENKASEIDRIIEFCGLEVSEEAKQRAIKRSSFEFMKRHEDKFGEQPKESKKVFRFHPIKVKRNSIFTFLFVNILSPS